MKEHAISIRERCEAVKSIIATLNLGGYLTSSSQYNDLMESLEGIPGLLEELLLLREEFEIYLGEPVLCGDLLTA